MYDELPFEGLGTIVG